MADETCPTCKFPFVTDEGDTYRRCSEFCARATDKELQEFKAAEPGLYCVYPCPECGVPIEGEWDPKDPGCICTECAPKVRIRALTGLLKETLLHLPEDLRTRVEEALKGRAAS